MMNLPMCKTSTNIKNLQNRDLPLITLITGKEWRPSEKEFLQWSTSYPDVDLARELRRIEDWFQKHLDRRKTERGMHTFVRAWFDIKCVDMLSASTARNAADIKMFLMISASDRNMISRSWKRIFCAYQAGQTRMNMSKLWTTMVQSEYDTVMSCPMIFSSGLNEL